MNITYNGHDYSVTVTRGGDVVHIYATGADGIERLVADAEKDSAVEQVFASYITPEDGCVSVECPSSLYWENAEAIATWLIDGLYF